MARQQVVSYSVTCDVCGEGIAEGGAEGASERISWQGADYLLDLCAAHRSALAELLGQLKVFVDAGEMEGASGRRRGAGGSAPRAKAVGRASKSRSGSGRPDVAAVRAWALGNGHQVGVRGRIPAGVVAAYDQAQAAEAAPVSKKGRSRKAVAAAASG